MESRRCPGPPWDPRGTPNAPPVFELRIFSLPLRRMRSGSEDITDGPMSRLWKGTRGDIPEGLGLGYTARGPGHGTVTLSPPRKKNLRSDKPEM